MTEAITTESILSEHNIFETVFERSPMPFVLFREIRNKKGDLADFEFSRLNQSAQELIAQKKSGDLLLGKKPSVQDTRFFENLLLAMTTGKPSEMEFYSTWLDQYFWLRITVHGVSTELLMAGLEDITPQKIAEHEMQEQARFAESISNTLPAVVMIMDLEKKEMVYMNHEVLDLLGYSMDEIRTFDQQYAIIHPDDLAHFHEYRVRILTAKDAETVQDELRIKAKDGSWQWYKVVGKVFKRNSQRIPVQYISAMLNITERKKAEAEMQENANLLQSVFETSLTGIAVMKSIRNGNNRIIDFEFTLLNSCGHRILGANIVGRKLSDVYTGDDTNALIVLNRQVVENGKTLDLETYYEGNGLKGWYHLAAAKMGDGVVVNFEDITGRKEAETKIKKTNDWLATVLDNTSNSIMALEAVRSQSGTLIDFRFLFINKKAQESVTRKKLKGKLFTKEFPGALTSGLFERYRKVVETGKGWTDEIHLDFEGMNVWALVNATKMGDGCLVSYLDITAIKRTEHQLRNSQQQLHTLVSNTPDSIARFDRNFAFTFVNRAFLKQTGLAEENVIGKTNSDIGTPQKTAAAWQKILSEVFETGQPCEMVTEYPAGGPNLFIVTKVVPEFDETGKVSSVLAIWRDITSIKKAEREVNTNDLFQVREDITDIKKAEQEIIRLKDEIAQKVTDKYHLIFNSVDEGFCILELLYDEEGKIKDLVFREQNPSFHKHTGLGNVIGQSLKKILPNFEQYWMEMFRWAAETGEPLTVENYAQDVDSWYKVQFLRVGNKGSRLVANVFENITERKHREQYQAYLLKLSDAIRPLTDALEIQKTATEILAKHLGVVRVFYYEINADQNNCTIVANYETAPLPVPPKFKLSDFGAEVALAYQAGQTIVVCDTDLDTPASQRDAYRAMGVRAWIGVPLVKNGILLTVLGIHSSILRKWTNHEVQLLQETAERLWSETERARAEEALRRNEIMLATFIEAVPSAIGMVDTNGRLLIGNREMQKFMPNDLIPSKDEKLARQWKAWDNKGNPVDPQDFPGALALQGTNMVPGLEMLFTQEDGTKLWTRVSSVPVKDKDGKITGSVCAITDINELKRSSEALQKSQKLLQSKELIESVLNTANIGITVFKANYTNDNYIVRLTCEMASKKAEEIFDHTPIIGRDLFEIMNNAWKFVPDIKRVIETGQRFIYETYTGTKDQEKFYRHTHIKFNDGLICITEDITERKLAQRGNYLAQVSGGGKMGELIRTKDWSLTPLGPLENWPQSLKTAVNLMLNSQQPTWIGWGPEATFLYNDAYISVLSRAKHPLALGLPAAQVWNEIWDFCGPLVTKVFEQGEASFADSVRLFMFRGSYYEETYYSSSYSPIRDQSGKVAGVFCPNTEVTAKILAARRLRTLSELAANALVEKTTASACLTAIKTLSKNTEDLPFTLLYLTDDDGRYASLQQYAGVPDNSPLVLDQKIDLHDLSALVHFPLPEVFRTGRSKTVFVDESFLVPKGLADQNVTRALVLPVKAPGQENPIGILVAGVNPARKIDDDYFTFYEIVANQVATAIDNAKEAEEEKKRIDLMAEVDRAKTTFFSNVSHEFRTPLTLMLGPLEEMITHPQEINDLARKNLSMVYNNTLRLQKLVNSLLDFSRIESGRISAAFQLTNVAELTTDLAGNFRSAIEKGGIEFIVHCEEFSDEVYVDRDMWEKIVLNLISNAFKYTYKGKIEITLKKIGKHFDFSVSDTGIGITPSEQKKVFERFYTVRNVQGRTQEGTGIGLSLVKELVKIHRGHIRLKSEPGKGSVFTVSIPLGKNHLPADKIVRNFSLQFKNSTDVPEPPKWVSDEAEDLLDSTERDTGKPIVLLCDDNTDMRNYIRRLIEKDYEVMTATNGREALEQIADQHPDLVLTDIMMPVMNGNELLKEIRKNPLTATLPVIMISARAGEEARIEGIDAGADAYVVKPFTARELISNMSSVLKTTAKRKQAENNEQKFRTLFNLIPSAIITLRGQQFMIETVNTTYLKMVGKSAVQLKKNRFFELFPEWRTKLEPILQEVMKQGLTYRHPQIQLELARDKNTEHYFSVTCQRTAPLRGEDWGIVLVMDDVSARLKNERLLDNQNLANSDELKKQLSALEKKVGRLERTKKELEQFHSVMSYDLKEPIRKIQTYCRLMQTEIADSTPRRYLQQIDAATERMKDLVGGILDRALLSENAPLSIPIDTGQMVEKVKEDLDMLIAEKNATITFSNMPLIKGRPFQFHQLFYNLIEHSLKHSVKNCEINLSGTEVTDTLVRKHKLDKNRKYAGIRLTDSGTDSDLKFAQDTFKYAGTVLTEKGIGLSICKKIVNNHYGVIYAEPGDEKGMVIIVILPLP